MPVMSEKKWEKHSNPWSGWSRMISYPLLFVAIWYHNWLALLLIAIWFAINPFLFPKPKSIDNWMSKGVLGEKIWTEKSHMDFPQLLNLFNGVFFIVAIYASYHNLLWHTFYSVILSSVFKMWFMDRMVFYYDYENSKK